MKEDKNTLSGAHSTFSRFRNCKDGTVLRNSAGYFHASHALHTRYTTAQAQNRDHEGRHNFNDKIGLTKCWLEVVH